MMGEPQQLSLSNLRTSSSNDIPSRCSTILAIRVRGPENLIWGIRVWNKVWRVILHNDQSNPIPSSWTPPTALMNDTRYFGMRDLPRLYTICSPLDFVLYWSIISSKTSIWASEASPLIAKLFWVWCFNMISKLGLWRLLDKTLLIVFPMFVP